MKSPKIRFKHHAGEEFPNWSSKKIGEILEIKHGKDYKNLPLGDIPVLGTGGIITYVSLFLCNWPCVLIGRKGTINKPQFMDKPFWSVDTLFYSKPKKHNSPRFQYYLFQTINWLKYSEATGVPSLSASTIENIAKSVPCLEEQQKIASFFSTLDQKIELNERKLEALEKLKKGLIQKIYRQEVRCHLNTKNSFLHWSTAKLGEISEIRGRIGFRGYSRSDITDEENGVISLSPANIDRGYVDARTGTYISRDKFEESPEIKVKNGDILFTKTGSTVGKIGIFKDLDLEATINPQMALITPIKVNPHFLMNYLLSHKARKYISSITVGGALPTLSQKELSQMPVPIPSDEEQEEIASLFSAVDQKISIIEIKLVNLRALKQGFMQQMFV